MIGQNGSHFKTTTYLDSSLTLYKSRYLVLDMSSFGLDNCFNPSRHTFYPSLTLFLINFFPLLHYSFPQLVNSCRSIFITWEASLQVIPGVFNGTKVGRLCKPVQKVDFLFFKPFLGFSRDMLGIIILFERWYHLLEFQILPYFAATPVLKWPHTAQHPFSPPPHSRSTPHSTLCSPISLVC